LYVDIDAHHGDQVQAAFYDSDQVFCLSFHESPNSLFPYETGFETEVGRGKGKGYNVNVPLPAGTGDEVFSWAFRELYPPIVKNFCPDVVIGVFGMDTIYSDPMTNLLLTNNAVIDAVEIVSRSAPRQLAFGCGGYVLDNLARGWTLAWAAMTRQEINNDQSLTVGGVFLGERDVSLRDGPHFVAEKTLAEKKEIPFVSDMKDKRRQRDLY
jgi:acetoin utilization protein AcuC